MPAAGLPCAPESAPSGAAGGAGLGVRQRRARGVQVRVVLAGIDKHDNLFGSVVFADAAEKPVELGEQLLRAGLARVRARPWAGWQQLQHVRGLGRAGLHRALALPQKVWRRLPHASRGELGRQPRLLSVRGVRAVPLRRGTAFRACNDTEPHGRLSGVAACTLTLSLALACPEEHVAGPRQCPEWSVAMLSTAEAFKLRNAERAAKQAKAGLWRNYVAPASAGAKLSDRFEGPVVEVASGDCLVVLDRASGARRGSAARRQGVHARAYARLPRGAGRACTLVEHTRAQGRMRGSRAAPAGRASAAGAQAVRSTGASKRTQPAG